MGPRNNGHYHEPSVDFDFGALDPADPEAQAWALQAELFGHLLRWLTTGRGLASVGARCYLLALYVNPTLIGMSSLHEIAQMRGSPCPAALSKALLALQRQYKLKPGRFQKLPWVCERYSRSAIAVHAERRERLGREDSQISQAPGIGQKMTRHEDSF